MAKNYAESLGKPVKAKDALSNCWFYSFLKRWPNLKVAKPQKLTIVRAKSASRDTLGKYYKELGTILTNHNLRDKPQNIYNVDESGVSTEHSPPKTVCSTNTKTQNITSTRSSNVTIIAAGNALGNSVPHTIFFQVSDGTLISSMEHVLVLLVRCQRKCGQILKLFIITSPNILSHL